MDDDRRLLQLRINSTRSSCAKACSTQLHLRQPQHTELRFFNYYRLRGYEAPLSFLNRHLTISRYAPPTKNRQLHIGNASQADRLDPVGKGEGRMDCSLPRQPCPRRFSPKSLAGRDPRVQRTLQERAQETPIFYNHPDAVPKGQKAFLPAVSGLPAGLRPQGSSGGSCRSSSSISFKKFDCGTFRNCRDVGG